MSGNMHVTLNQVTLNIDNEQITIDCNTEEMTALEDAAETVSLALSRNKANTENPLLITALNLAKELNELKLYRNKTEGVLRGFNQRLHLLLEKYPTAEENSVEEGMS